MPILSGLGEVWRPPATPGVCSIPRWRDVPKTEGGRLMSGVIVPSSESFGFITGERTRLIAKVTSTGYTKLVQSGWLHYEDCPFPLAPEFLTDAERLVRYDAEWQTRRQVQYAEPADAWRPWTDDQICQPCHYYFTIRRNKPTLHTGGGWTGRGGAAAGWKWAGINSLPIGLTANNAHVITCGMLRDAGVITSAAECMEQDYLAQSAYRTRWEEILKDRMKVSRWERNWGYYAMAAQVITTIAATVLAGPAGTAAGAAMMAASTAVQNGGIDWKDGMDIGIAATGLIPVVGGVLSASLSAIKTSIELIQTIDEIKDAKKEIKEKRSQLEAANQVVLQQIQDRAELWEIEEAVRVLKAQIAASKRDLGIQDLTPFYALGALAALAVVMVGMR